ncbi:hypothetical protein FRB90_008106 [Tulasnella sp. 427]|nr:hypothetical protein FRB90_008106 [Tulasnella sp. 427]
MDRILEIQVQGEELALKLQNIGSYAKAADAAQDDRNWQLVGGFVIDAVRRLNLMIAERFGMTGGSGTEKNVCNDEDESHSGSSEAGQKGEEPKDSTVDGTNSTEGGVAAAVDGRMEGIEFTGGGDLAENEGLGGGVEVDDQNERGTWSRAGTKEVEDEETVFGAKVDSPAPASGSATVANRPPDEKMVALDQAVNVVLGQGDQCDDMEWIEYLEAVRFLSLERNWRRLLDDSDEKLQELGEKVHKAHERVMRLETDDKSMLGFYLKRYKKTVDVDDRGMLQALAKRFANLGL